MLGEKEYLNFALKFKHDLRDKPLNLLHNKICQHDGEHAGPQSTLSLTVVPVCSMVIMLFLKMDKVVGNRLQPPNSMKSGMLGFNLKIHLIVLISWALEE